MSVKSDQRRPRLSDDPLAIRALAHPTRLSLYLLVGRNGPVTAAGAARHVGISQALASHHLRQLAKYGFVEAAEPRDGRERPWRATPPVLHTGSDAPGPTTDVLGELCTGRALAHLADWNTHAAGWAPKWRHVTGARESTLHLTYEELRELQEGITALLAPLVRRGSPGGSATCPTGAVPVAFTQIIAPLPADTNHD